MGDDDGIVTQTVRIIACSVRNDDTWGALALKHWHEGRGNASTCVSTAQQELYGSGSRDYDSGSS